MRASGNPSEGNSDVSAFKKMIAQKLAEMGKISNTSLPYKAEYVIDHAKMFLSTDSFDIRNVLLHAIQLTAMNCGMRFNETMKLKMDSFKCTKH